ncbi:hypothetical protein, variant 3 [Verruconis gallopava]|uniref:Zn(2)-C6 fungal-type domain-containing protein n=1 Tax=Verruconis gallopava TaxID=253628 RepID=A0A0D2AJV5_9PEZI|nr:hypothetical protein, variant 3 [Verruconis gallopava]KIW06850.1 hypothetical protein, variant 3 [Verruconis gallopava]
MYSQFRQPHSTSSTSAARQRPDLTLTKSPRWSYSHSLEQAYPSPPMSDTPTSPRRSSLYLETTSSSAYPGSYSTSHGRQAYPLPATDMEGTMLASSASYQQPPYGHDSRGYYPPQQRPELQPRPMSHLPYPSQTYDQYLSATPSSMPMIHTGQHPMVGGPTYPQGPTSLSSSSAPRAQRTTRRTKAHVAKACQNCKKAHLSCDEARPCARCVASGKQATCIDVEHKKRGRPRLRDDREQRLEQAAAAAVAATQTGPQSADLDRGHRRRDSLRVLRTQAYGSGSEDSRPSTSHGMPASALYGSTSASVAYTSMYTSRSSNAQLSAFLNLDLQILKASEPLRALLGGNHDIVDRPLSDFVTAQYEGPLQRIQNELRDERARREPTYLPAIYPEQQERAAVRDHDPENSASLSGDFQDRQDVYTFRVTGGSTEQFQVRIRLARTTTFFATMILYRLQPPAPQVVPSPYVLGSHYVVGDPSSPARSPYQVSNPESPFSSMQPALITTLHPPSSIPPSYVYSSPEQGHFGRAPPGMQPPPSLGPFAATPERRPPTSMGQRGRPGLGESVQLPPIGALRDVALRNEALTTRRIHANVED